MQSCAYRRLFSCSASKIISKQPASYGDINIGRNPKTLQYRFIKHLENTISTETNLRKDNVDFPVPLNKVVKSRTVPESSKFSLEYMNADLLMGRNFGRRCQGRSILVSEDVTLILNQIENLENTNETIDNKSLMHMLDRKCCNILNLLSYDEILLLLNKFAEVTPYRVAALNIYSKAMEKLRNILSDTITSYKIVNLLFLMSLRKSMAAPDVALALKQLHNMHRLSVIDQCIVSTAAFRSGVMLDRSKIQIIEDTLLSNLNTLMQDHALLISLIKALRHSGPSPGFSLVPISKKLLKTGEKYDLAAAVPILALYAEMLVINRKVMQRLVRDSIYDLKRSRLLLETHKRTPYLDRIRIKDVDRLLWVVSRLHYALSTSELVEVLKFVDNKLNKFSINPKIFSGTLLSLWMLGSKNVQMIEYCFHEKIFQPLLHSSPQDQSKLHLLLNCVKIEAPEVKIPPQFTKKISKQVYKPCRELETVSEILKCLASHLALTDTKIDCPIEELRIYGISTRHQSLGWIHIDILNKVTCLQGTKKPHGLMSLKLRLVETLGYHSILLDNDGVIRIETMFTTIEKSINSLLQKVQE